MGKAKPSAIFRPCLYVTYFKEVLTFDFKVLFRQARGKSNVAQQRYGI
jgi:hypothetical protein